MFYNSFCTFTNKFSKNIIYLDRSRGLEVVVQSTCEPCKTTTEKKIVLFTFGLNY